MGFSRQEYSSGLPCPSPGDLPNPGIQPKSPMSPALGDGVFTTLATREAPLNRISSVQFSSVAQATNKKDEATLVQEVTDSDHRETWVTYTLKPGDSKPLYKARILVKASVSHKENWTLCPQ